MHHGVHDDIDTHFDRLPIIVAAKVDTRSIAPTAMQVCGAKKDRESVTHKDASCTVVLPENIGQAHLFHSFVLHGG